MKFTVMGAGAVGGAFGAKLAAAGHDVLFVARDPHLSAIRYRGLVVEGPKGRIEVRARCSDRPADADVILFTVKAYDTREAADLCRGVRGHVLTLQNGLGHEEILLQVLGDRVIGGVAYVGAAVVAPGRIHHETGGWIVAGEFDGRASERLAAVKAAFDGAGAPCETTNRIRAAMWEKLLANAVFNVISAAWGIELGAILLGEHRARAERAIGEVCAVAAAHGIEIRPEVRDQCFAFCEGYPTFKTSTQQDVARGKPTEAEFLTGAVLRYANARGVAAPTIAELHAKLRSVS